MGRRGGGGGLYGARFCESPNAGSPATRRHLRTKRKKHSEGVTPTRPHNMPNKTPSRRRQRPHNGTIAKSVPQWYMRGTFPTTCPWGGGAHRGARVTPRGHPHPGL
jgi:hypothetical protein